MSNRLRENTKGDDMLDDGTTMIHSE